MRHSGRHAGDVRAFGRHLPFANDVGDPPAQHDVALFNRMGMQGRPAVRLGFGQHKGEPIEPVIFAMNRITTLPRLVIEAAHLIDLDHVVGSIEGSIRGTRLAVRWQWPWHGDPLLASLVRRRSETNEPTTDDNDREQDVPSVHMNPHTPAQRRRRHRRPSRFQFCQLIEVGVVVRDGETVDPGARKDDQVRKRDGHA
jgi:hypothetical protein